MVDSMQFMLASFEAYMWAEEEPERVERVSVSPLLYKAIDQDMRSKELKMRALTSASPTNQKWFESLPKLLYFEYGGIQVPIVSDASEVSYQMVYKEKGAGDNMSKVAKLKKLRVNGVKCMDGVTGELRKTDHTDIVEGYKGIENPTLRIDIHQPGESQDALILYGIIGATINGKKGTSHDEVEITAQDVDRPWMSYLIKGYVNYMKTMAESSRKVEYAEFICTDVVTHEDEKLLPKLNVAISLDDARKLLSMGITKEDYKNVRERVNIALEEAIANLEGKRS